jgi:protein O-GlcNAc transferase
MKMDTLAPNKTGRNSLCPCGSGKKYKQCCLPKQAEPAVSTVARATEIAAALQVAIAHHNAGRLQQAEGIYQQILQLSPQHPDALHLLGLIAYASGKHQTAIELISQALQVRPNMPHAHYNLGVTLQAQGRLKEAAASYRQALKLKPDYVDAYNNLGNLLKQQDRLAEAVVNYRQALRLRPDFVDAHYNLGNVLREQDKLAEAMISYQQTLVLKPDHVEAHNNLSNVLQSLGQLEEAAASLRAALRISPQYVEAHVNLGNILKELGRADEAAASFRQAISLRPDYVEAHVNLGNVLKDRGRALEAIASYREALKLNPRLAVVYANLGNAFKDCGRLDEAVGNLRKAIELEPGFALAYSNLIFTMLYDSELSPAELYEASREFAASFEAPHIGNWPRHGNSCASGRRLKIGYVSADFRNHALASFFEQVIENHDHSKFETYCYYNHTIQDYVTERLRKLSDHWLQCTSLNDEQLASRIQADGIDILVDLSGHTAGNRLPVFARKPAPVQVTWMGYCGTTGLSAMDYRFTEIYLDPEGMSERYYTEKFVYLPSALVIFQSEPGAPEVNGLPALSGEGFTFACLNNPSKLNERVIALWARILQAVPGSRLMLGNAKATEEKWLLELFARHGVGSERLLLQPRVGILDYLALHHQIDLALDPFPYNGGTTTLHSLWMGVPVLTLAGDRTVSRVGASIMNGFGLSRFVAESEEAYFERAVELSRDLTELGGLRHGLRACIAANSTCDAAGYTRAVEAAYQNMWQHWCEQREQR